MVTVKSREEFLHRVAQVIPMTSACIEIGVLHGDFSAMILREINPRTLLLIDPFNNGGKKYSDGLSTAYSTIGDYYNICERFKDEMRKWQVHVEMNYSFNAVKTRINNTYDFIYHFAANGIEDGFCLFNILHIFNDVYTTLSHVMHQATEYS